MYTNPEQMLLTLTFVLAGVKIPSVRYFCRYHTFLLHCYQKLISGDILKEFLDELMFFGGFTSFSTVFQLQLMVIMRPQ